MLDPVSESGCGAIIIFGSISEFDCALVIVSTSIHDYYILESVLRKKIVLEVCDC